MNILGPSIMKDNMILSIQVRTPVADFHRALIIQYLEYGLLVVVTDSDRLLVLLEEIIVRRRRYTIERTVGDSCTRFGGNIIGNKEIDCRFVV